jgi:hypothetical protein
MAVRLAGDIVSASDPGRELAYAEITAASAAFTAQADIAGLSITFTLTETRTVLVQSYMLGLSTIASDRIQFTLTDAANVQVQLSADLFIPANNVTVHAFISWRAQLAAGSYTYKIRGQRNVGTGSCIANAAVARPNYIQALDYGPA